MRINAAAANLSLPPAISTPYPLRKYYVDVAARRMRCATHISGSHRSRPPPLADSILLSRLRLFVSHSFSVPAITVAAQTDAEKEPGALVTASGAGVVLVVGSARVLNLGQVPFTSANRIVEDFGPQYESPPYIAPIGFKVLRNFWSYRNPGKMTTIEITRVLATCISLEDSFYLSESYDSTSFAVGKAARDQFPVANTEVNLSGGKAPNFDEGFVVRGKRSRVSFKQFDDYELNNEDKLEWRVEIKDDPEGCFTVATATEILPQLLAKYNPPLPINMNHPYLRRPEKFALLDHPSVLCLIESMQNSAQCTNYSFRYYTVDEVSRRQEVEMLACRGSARTDGLRPVPPPSYSMPAGYIEAAHDFLAALTNAQKADFYYEYKERLQKETLSALEVRPSRIHGMGLFARIDIAAFDLVIEYTGELIGSHIADKRERLNELRKSGIYFYGVDHDTIIDATVFGNISRFINHSCEPNCVTKTFYVDGSPHVFVVACRLIKAGEELTYDYNFKASQDVNCKVKCNCGSANCHMYLN